MELGGEARGSEKEMMHLEDVHSKNNIVILN
jgi:hypothetical protein